MITNITPDTEEADHVDDSTCHCRPIIRFVEGDMFIIHHAFKQDDLTADEIEEILAGYREDSPDEATNFN